MEVKELRIIIGQRLRDLRTARGWTQGQVAAEAHVTRDFICRCERGLREPSLYVLTKLARVFQVQPVFLLTPIEEADSAPIRELNALVLNRTDEEIRWVTGVVRYLLNHAPTNPKETSAPPQGTKRRKPDRSRKE